MHRIHYAVGMFVLLFAATTWAQAPIGSFTVRLVNKVTRVPLVSNQYPFPWGQLYRCVDPECVDRANQTALQTDRNGQATVSHDDDGTPLPAGIYQVRAATGEPGGKNTPSPLYTVDAGEHVSKTHGVIGQRLGIRVLDPCADIPAHNSVCTFSLEVTNQFFPKQSFSGKLWLHAVVLVDNDTVGASTIVQLGSPRQVNLQPAQRTVLDFSFKLPANVQPGTTVCFAYNIGRGTTPHFQPVGSNGLQDPDSSGNPTTVWCIDKPLQSVG